jgi:hypothetical protein
MRRQRRAEGPLATTLKSLGYFRSKAEFFVALTARLHIVELRFIAIFSAAFKERGQISSSQAGALDGWPATTKQGGLSWHAWK